MAPTTVSLYEEAFTKFRKYAADHYRDSKEQELLGAFLHERTSPEDTREAALSLRVDSKKKYGSKKVGDVVIPDQWIDKIMGNIGNFVAAGNMATKGAPESVGIAWYAVKLTLTAIQNNYELYTFFGTGLSDISEIMIIIRHYDRLYDERANAKWKPSPLVEKLFSDVISAYEAVLDFSFAIKRHLTAGTLSRIKHGFKDFFGTSKTKFEGKLGTIAELKRKIVEGSQGAFQDRTFTQLEGVSAVMKGIESTVNDIQQFQVQQEQWHKENTARLDTILQAVEDIKSTTKRKTPWDYSFETFNANRKTLKPLQISNAGLAAAIDSIHPGTCEWVLQDSQYRAWRTSKQNTMLRIFGREGTGKSTVVASIMKHLDREGTPDEEVFYFSCETSGAAGSTEQYDAERVCNTILWLLYGLAVEGQQDVHLLDACNDLFKNPKSKEAKKMGRARTAKEDDLPDFADAFAKMTLLLKKKIVLVLDGVNSNMTENHQAMLADGLTSLIETDIIKPESGVAIKILVGCASSTPFCDNEKLPGSSINIEYDVKDDMVRVLKDALKNTPSLSSAEQEEAEAVILDKAATQFRYLCEVAIPFVREPFVRPISRHLEALPNGLTDKYSQALRKMKPNYVGVLHTALTWTLLSRNAFPAFPTGREIMDAFYGTYDSLPELSDESQGVKDQATQFPPITRVELDQLREASGLFLSSWLVDGSNYFYAPEFQQVTEFCCGSKKQDHTDGHGIDVVCPRCKSEMDRTATLSIDPKEAHLQMAITCLRHLNHPVFQQRAGLLVEPDPSPEEGEEDGGEGEDSGEGKEAAGKSNAGNEEEKSLDGEDVSVENAAKVDAEKKTDNENDSGYDSDDSLDYEDEAELHRQDDDTYEESSDDYARIRYELQYWMDHVRKAEDLWTSEERAGSDAWKELFDQFDKFASNTIVFERWQRLVPGFLAANDLDVYKPLHVAAAYGLVSLAKHLINDQGADPKEISQRRTTLQTVTRSVDRPELVRFLLGLGVDVNYHAEGELPALYEWLNKDGNLELVQAFLDAGANPKLLDHEGWTALHFFAWNGSDPKIIDLLIDHGADINAKDQDDDTPLHYLLLRRDVPKDVLSAFINKGANVNAEDKQSTRPLQMAANWGDIEILKTILENGVTEIDDPDTIGATALYEAAVNGHAETVRLLAAAGADPGVKSKSGYVALHMAAWKQHPDCVQALLDLDRDHRNADINHPAAHDRTPFFYACMAEDTVMALSILDALVAKGLSLPEINYQTKFGRSPLRQAAERGHEEVVARLIQLATDQNDFASLHINRQDAKKGMTPLHRAARGGHLGCVRHLLDLRLNTDITLKDKEGHSALALAYQEWALESDKTAFEDILSILIDLDPAAVRHDAELVAVIAANGSTRLLKQLWRLGANLNLRDQYGWTPLEIARRFMQKATEEFLSKQQAWTNMLPSRWGASFPSTTPAGARSLSEDGTKITHISGERLCVASDRPLPAGLEQYYFEVTLGDIPIEDGFVPDQKEHPIFAIGFCTMGGAAHIFPGWEPKPKMPKARSWAFHADDGGFFNSTAPDGLPSGYAPEFMYGSGDTIGCGVNLANQEMFFTKNGVKVPQPNPFKDVNGRLFPVLGLREQVYCETNFGGEPFKWKDEYGLESLEKVGQQRVAGDGVLGGTDTVVEVVQHVDDMTVSTKVGVSVSSQSIVEGVQALEIR